MEKIKNTPNEAPPVINKLTEENILRCIDCNLICSLELNYKEGIPYIEYKCEKGHKNNILLKDYMIKSNEFSLSKEKCNECKKNQKEIKGNFFYCSKCDKFLCYQCLNNHKNEDRHIIFDYIKYDSLCKEHSNLYSFYCRNCKKNLCIYCKSKHKSHNIIDLSEFNYSEESKKKLKEEMENIENKIKDLDIIKQNIINQIDKLKESNELEINFMKILLFSYEYEEKQNNLNYYIIQNLINFEKNFKSNIIKIYEDIYNEGNKYISYIQKLQKNKNEKIEIEL